MLINILKKFQEWNPELVEKMKNCSHHYDENNLSPYHLECSVLAHTMLVFKEVENFCKLNTVSEKEIEILAICALAHDIGKIYTRLIPKEDKIAFYGHAFASIQDTIDFMDYIESNYYYEVLSIIGNHMDFMLSSKSEKKSALCNYDKNLFDLAALFKKFDINGSFSEEERAMTENKYTPPYEPELNDPNIIIFSGVPGSGKDYMAKKLYPIIYPTISFDKIRYEIYKAEMGKSPSNYKEAFEYCKDKDLNSYLITKIDSVLTEYPGVCICNTNLTRKARRKIINMVKNSSSFKRNAVFESVFVFSEKENLIERDRTRGERDKTVGIDIINKFAYNQQMPTMDEGFDSIRFVKN